MCIRICDLLTIIIVAFEQEEGEQTWEQVQRWGLLSVVFSVRPGPFHLDPAQCANQVLKAEILECEMRIIRQFQVLKVEILENDMHII